MISLCGRDCNSCVIKKKEKMCNGCSMCDVSFCKCGEKESVVWLFVLINSVLLL